MTERVLVTGGARGIGAAIAAQCRADGYDVITIDRERGGIQADLADARETADALDEALAGGPITRLVNNVGIIRPKRIEDTSFDDLSAVMSVNVRCGLQCLQATLHGMRAARFGRVVNISSRAALGKAARTAYAVSKAGINGMTRVWALELGSDGITVNAVAPGPIKTELFDTANPPGAPATEAIKQAIPVGRMGEPAEVAAAVGFFLSPGSGFTTGQTLYVCGGMTVGLDS